MQAILTTEELEKAKVIEAQTLETKMYTLKNGVFGEVLLPILVQSFPIQAISPLKT